jgi:hypothetical protein
VRTAALGAALAVTLVTTLVAGALGDGPPGRDERPFELEGWDYSRILPPGAPARYRLRVDVVRTLVLPERDDTGPDGSAPSSEFRLLLERRDDANFVCLRWLDGDLEILRIADGERAPLVGQTSYPLPCIGPDERTHSTPAPESFVPESFVIDRSPGLWTVAWGGRELTVAGDPDAREVDATEAGDFAWGATPQWSLSSRALQPVEDIHLEDGFAKVDFNEDGTYDVRSGTWDLDAVKHAERSVNAFRLRGRSRSTKDGAEPAVALFGRSFWRRYRAEAAIRFRRPGAGGLVFAAQRDVPPPGPLARVVLLKEGEKEGQREGARKAAKGNAALPLARYGLLRWRYPEGTNGAPGGLEVLDVRIGGAADGEESRRERVLLSLPWTPRRDQWHRVAVSLFDGLGEVEVNGARAVFRLPAGLRAGECGVFADSERGVLFDDIRVASHGAFLHRPGAGPAPWSVGAAETEEGAAVYRLPAGPAWLRLGLREEAPPASVSWRDAAGATVSVEIDPVRGRGEVTRSLDMNRAADEAPTYAADDTSTDAEAADARHVAEFDVPGPGEYSLRLDADACTVLCGPTAVASFPLRSTREGAVTVGSPEELAELAGGALPPRPALRHKARAFSDVDVRMHSEGMHPEHKWIGFVGWMKDESSWVRGPKGLLACETLLWGSCEASVEVPLPKAGGKPVELRFAAARAGVSGAGVSDARDGKKAGVGLRRGPGGFVILDADGNERGAFTPPTFPEDAPGDKVRLALRRAGERVEAWVAGERAFATRLGPRAPVRVEARAPGLAPGEVEIRSDTVDESLFESAPAEWTRWRGHWDVTTKWQCDPRWTFLGVWSHGLERKSDAAGAFTRASYLGDQDLRLYFAFRDVLNNKHGDNRRYVRRDMNFAFACADEDPASGYCLMIGGFDNRGTQLLRRGKLVHEVRDFRIPPFRPGVGSGDIHWRWFCLRILNRGGAITASVNGKEVLSWMDPEPLEGGHVGLWTVGGGMILGRTRFSAERRGPELRGFATSPPPPPVEGWWPVDEDHAARVAPAEDSGLAVSGTTGGTTGGRTGGGNGHGPHVVRVTNRAAGGHLGVAYSVGGNGSTPAAVAFRAEPGVRVRAYAARGSALKPGTPIRSGRRPHRVIPEDDDPLPADGEWHVLRMTEALREGDALVVGNWESDGYAAAGIGANGPQASYEVGVFAKPRDAEAFVRRVEEGAILSVMTPNPHRPSADPSPAARTLAAAGGWEVLDWGNPARVSVLKRPDDARPGDGRRDNGRPGTGREFLLLRSSSGKHGKSVIRIESALSLAPRGKLRVDVFNATAREVPVAFAVWSGADYVYSESRLRPALPNQWNHIEFDLAARDFKSADSCWKHTSALRGAGSVREVALLFYGNAPGAVAVENIEVDVDSPASAPAPAAAAPAPPPDKPREASPERRRPEPKPAPKPEAKPEVKPAPKPAPKPRRRREDPGGPF